MKKIILVLLYIFLLLYLFFGVSDNVIYSHGGLGWLLFLLAFPAQAFLIYLIARSFSLKPYTSKGAVALAILVSCPLFGIYLKKKQSNQLSVGDTLHILYFQDNPNNCMIIELKDK